MSTTVILVIYSFYPQLSVGYLKLRNLKSLDQRFCKCCILYYKQVIIFDRDRTSVETTSSTFCNIDRFATVKALNKLNSSQFISLGSPLKISWVVFKLSFMFEIEKLSNKAKFHKSIFRVRIYIRTKPHIYRQTIEIFLGDNGSAAQ